MEPNPEVVTKPVPPAEPSNTGTIISVLCAVAVIGVAGFALRHELLTKMMIAQAEQKESISKLSAKVSALESQTATLAAQPKPNTEEIESLHGGLGAAQDTIIRLNERITMLEQKPTPPPVIEAPKPQAPLPAAAPAARITTDSPLVAFIKSGAAFQTELGMWEKDHPAAADRIPHLRAASANGLASDDTLRIQLRAALDRVNTPATPIADNTLIKRINSNLAGLISIKKKSVVAPELSILTASADSASIAMLTSRVEALPAEQKPFFTAWLDAVRARDAALAELPVLDGAL